MDSSTAQFTRLWTANLPKVAAFVGSMVHQVSDRDDVLQDCAVAAMTSFERYDPERPFPAWVIGVARNQVRLYLRRKSKDPHVFDDEVLDLLVDSFTKHQPEEEKLDRLEHCVGQLEGKARQICEYRYSHDLKPAAIATKLGMTPNSVAKSLQRIREQLRLCLEKSPLQS
ncbi:sigma-70 family RNA polymerase sigma factor [Akkermansiaceae bacterium]|nr:sigma-70 family RNA polymerase sigma factor [Akkermansiaceae bacterium]MDA7629232.1 sigma-70 family RNA polymerase sigma factor [Akkermansiaceae bacterium]MDA7877899.1 sigma-70 family RNA polymerase sigma factor [Akkermansiaceae bacterium]MDB4142507.1 sigma-70 family RNA polymerase sigma factor [Akkermansiaceae bacterium]MDB4314392.1 sigma-70 family RNA polymerase sigma factor [Akkermansiaceae bacterium]